MKSILRLLLVPLVTLVFAGASFAQGTPGAAGTTGTKSSTPAPAKPAEKKAATQKMMRARGEIVSADTKAGMLSVKSKDKELSLTAESQDAKDALAKVKVGDTVRIAYVEKDGKLTLRSVAKAKASTAAKATPTKPSEKKEETKPAK